MYDLIERREGGERDDEDVNGRREKNMVGLKDLGKRSSRKKKEECKPTREMKEDPWWWFGGESLVPIREENLRTSDPATVRGGPYKVCSLNFVHSWTSLKRLLEEDLNIVL